MVKQQKSEGVANSTRNASKRISTRTRQPHKQKISTRGRPPKQKSESNPYQIQNQFTQDFIQFGRQYLDWRLNENYIWTDDFEKGTSMKYEKLPIENSEQCSAINAIISNMNNMMEQEVGRQFREICILSYDLYQKQTQLSKASQIIFEKINKQEDFSFLRLRNKQIPNERKHVREQVLTSFYKSIVELIYKVSEKNVSSFDKNQIEVVPSQNRFQTS